MLTRVIADAAVAGLAARSKQAEAVADKEVAAAAPIADVEKDLIAKSEQE